MTFQNPDSLVRNMDSYFIGRNDRIAHLGMTIDTFLNIPGLVGFWPMSSVQRSTGNAFDLSGQGRTLTYNGNPTYNIENDLVPYIDLDGVGDFLSRADETDLDILMTETIYDSSVRGITFGGWFFFDVLPAATSHIMSKWAAPTFQYLMYYNGTFFDFRTNAVVRVTSTVVPNTLRWYFMVCTLVPSTSATIHINDVATTSVAAIPASIPNGTGAFEIGAAGGGTLPIFGRASLCFLSANAIGETYINALFQQSRVLFGV